MALEYHDTMVPSHQYGNIGNDTAKWDDGWFSDTVHARRFEGSILEANTVTANTVTANTVTADILTSDALTANVVALHLADYKKIYFGTSDDTFVYFDSVKLFFDGGGNSFRFNNGSVGVGITAGGSAKLNVLQETSYTAGSVIGVFSTVKYGSSGSGNTSQGIWGLYFDARTEADYDGDITGAVYGCHGVVNHYGSGTISSCWAFGVKVNIRAGGGDVTNAYGMNISFTDASSVGEYGNIYGIYVNNVNLATGLNFAVYTQDGIVYHKDSMGIGITTPGEKLEVVGNILLKDNYKSIYGTGKDAAIYYDESDFVFDSREAGTGDFLFNGGSLGVGAAPLNAKLLCEQVTSVTTSHAMGLRSTVTFGATLGAANMPNGIYALYFNAQTDAAYSGNIADVVCGMAGVVNHYGTGTLASAYGMRASVNIQAGGGDITKAHGLFISFVDLSGVGEIDDARGLYIADVNVGITKNYAIYTNDGICFLKDCVGIGTSNPVEKLKVIGNIWQNDNGKHLFGNTKDASIYFDSVDLVIDPAEIASGGVKIVGDMFFSGAGAGLPFGEIYCKDVHTTITISGTGVANREQITAFTNDGNSNLTTPAHASDHITISKTGQYFATLIMHVESTGGAPYTMGFEIRVNNGATVFDNTHTHNDFSGGGSDAETVACSGLISLTAADTLEAWCYNDTGTEDIIIVCATLSVFMVGA